MNILILCQRRRSLNLDNKNIQQTNKNINTYLNDVFPGVKKCIHI